jgi:PhzF family phenazine biosynthesis protein
VGADLFLVDAFAERAFAGNAAAVCLVKKFREVSWLLAVARELAQSETAFVGPVGPGGARELRWFTPNREVDLCGHATLAAAHVLWQTGAVPASEEIVFSTRSGNLSARSNGADIEITLPARPCAPCPTPGDVALALGLEPMGCYRSQRDYLVLVERDLVVRELKPNLELLERDRSLIVTAQSEARAFDFVSRYFDPIDGEDPVTGSAHATLGPFWGGRLHKTELLGYQASSRGGVVRVRLGGPVVHLSGRAITVAKGTLEVQ